MKIINLTPHEVRIVKPDGIEKVIETSGTVARCIEETQQVGSIDGIPIIRKLFGEVENLPEPEEGTLYIVSALVAQAVKEREDVYIPGDLIRDEAGRITGCKALCRV